MVKHIVMWKLKAFAEGKSRADNVSVLREKLERLKELIPEIKTLELGVNFSSSDHAYDVILYSEFKNRKDLELYQNHPEHRVVADFVSKIRSERKVVDYEI
jgi:proline dehydrogenase